MSPRQLVQDALPLLGPGELILEAPLALGRLGLAAQGNFQGGGDPLLLGGLRPERGLRGRDLLLRERQGLGSLLQLMGVLRQLLVQMVLPEVAPLQLDLGLLDPLPEGVDLGDRGQELSADGLDPRRHLLQVAFGGGDLPLVGFDGQGGLVALGGELEAALFQGGQRIHMGLDLRLAPLGHAAVLLGALADLLDRLTVGLEELLPALDRGGELSHLLVPLGHGAGEVVEPLAPLGESGLVAVEIGAEARFAQRGVLDLRAQLVEASGKDRPAAGKDLLQQVAVFDLLLLIAPGGAGLTLEGTEGALDLRDDVVQAQEVGGGLLQLDLGHALARLVASDAGGLLDELAALLGLAREDHPDLALLDHRIGADAQAGVHQEILDLLQPDHPAVQPVLALAAAEDPAADRHPPFVRAGI